MNLTNFKAIETKYELVKGSFIYHVIVGDDSVMIKRTSKDRPMWSHGALTQGYDCDAADFLPMIRVNRLRLTHAEAEKVIDQL